LRILGIDPGSVICGYGVIDSDRSNLSLVEYGVVKAGKSGKDLPKRLKEIFTRLSGVIERTRPDVAAFESMFFHKNAQSLMKLSHARGAAMAAVGMVGIEVFEYSPKTVKKSVTGRGGAAKEQVAFMVLGMLEIKETPEFFDSTDALAVAICHSNQFASGAKKSSSWADFIKNNPDKVIE
jgi:crossover junction endodeoxyribonuclease RuvC